MKSKEEIEALNKRRDDVHAYLSKQKRLYWCASEACACMGCVNRFDNDLNVTMLEYVRFLEGIVRASKPTQTDQSENSEFLA